MPKTPVAPAGRRWTGPANRPINAFKQALFADRVMFGRRSQANDPGAPGTFGSLIAAASYPVVMALAFGSCAALQTVGLPAGLAAYAAVLAGASLIVWHELALPYRKTWTPGRADIATDLLFLVLVQIALPFLLALTLVTALANGIRDSGHEAARLWPHDLPVWLQIVIMLLVADFGRYWLHRAFHKVRMMWRFHAVHHSPHRLYSLNVGRFHPLEKAVQYTVDALPFALLGVSDEVLTLYFVFYAINGFYQHSNCLIHLGPLNFLVSGPELHRWHHSVLVEESDRNFGNNLIVWDIVFGTRFLPADREVGPLGLHNRHYPTDFLSQMATPFRAGVEGG